MAGDWIKMRSDLFTHPKVVRMASALKADTLRTVGGLMSAWCLFDAHSVDGILPGYSSEILDEHLRWGGFSASMIEIGWLTDDGESLALPDFEAHNGQSAKRRAQDSDRKRAVRKTSASEADKMRTREEKRREEKKEQKKGPAAADLFPGVDPQIVKDFIAIRKAKNAPLTDTAIAGIKREAAKAGLSISEALTMCCERGWSGFKADWDGVSARRPQAEQKPMPRLTA